MKHGLSIDIIPVLNDNYAYLLQSGREVGVIDPGEAEPVIAELESRGLKLNYILNTHHHGDHTGGNAELKEKYGAKIAGPAKESVRIPGMNIKLYDRDEFKLGETVFKIIETPGHTMGHICFYVPSAKAIFTGDTLFSMGCGRLFEGTPQDMWNSFQKILKLPDDTYIHCGHEYTVALGRWALRIEPNNKDIKKRLAEAEDLREMGLPTLPVTLGSEKKTNVFLRAGSVEKFAEIRGKKNAA